MVDLSETHTDDFDDIFAVWKSDIVDPHGWKKTWLEEIMKVVDRTASLLLWWIPGNAVPEGC